MQEGGARNAPSRELRAWHLISAYFYNTSVASMMLLRGNCFTEFPGNVQRLDLRHSNEFALSDVAHTLVILTLAMSHLLGRMKSTAAILVGMGVFMHKSIPPTLAYISTM